MQRKRNSSVYALELRLLCIKPSIHQCPVNITYFCCALFSLGYVGTPNKIQVMHAPISFRMISLALEQSHDWLLEYQYSNPEEYRKSIDIKPQQTHK